MNQSNFVAIPCNLLKAREKSHVQVGFGFPRSSFQYFPIFASTFFFIQANIKNLGNRHSY